MNDADLLAEVHLFDVPSSSARSSCLSSSAQTARIA
jgi:hypothetical protein